MRSVTRKTNIRGRMSCLKFKKGKKLKSLLHNSKRIIHDIVKGDFNFKTLPD